MIEVPLHVAWSGRRVYDVGDADQRLVLYALLLAEAQCEDLERFLHRESPISMWTRLRRLLGPHARREWERHLMPTDSYGLQTELARNFPTTCDWRTAERIPVGDLGGD
jgi:hypothetical protein